MLKAEIIAVGTEILMGDVINSNATMISRELKALNIGVYYHHVVGDNLERIKSLLNDVSQRSEMVILCGGIGPTEDDLTKAALSEFLNEPLIYDDKTLLNLHHFFNRQNRVMTENNKKQALYLKNGDVLSNPVGLAIGCSIKKNGVHYIVLPGPPKELECMLKESVASLLQNESETVLVSKTLKFALIGESTLAHCIDDLIQYQTNPTIAIYAKDGLVDVRLSANGKSNEDCLMVIKPIKEEVIRRLKDYFYGCDDDTLASLVVEKLKQKQLRLSAVESFTGGLFQSEIVSVSGASTVFYGGFVTYQTSAKIDGLHVSESIISEYGVYSHECASEMAKNGKQITKTDICVSFTGQASKLTEENDIYQYVAIALPNDKMLNFELQFNRSREYNRKMAVNFALKKLLEFI